MAKRIRSGDVLLQAERTKRNARAESLGGARSVYPTPRANAQIAAVGEALPERMAEVGTGGELVPFDNAGLVSAFRDTLVHPDSVIKDASHDRLELLKKAGVVEMGLRHGEPTPKGTGRRFSARSRLASCSRQFVHCETGGGKLA